MTKFDNDETSGVAAAEEGSLEGATHGADPEADLFPAGPSEDSDPEIDVLSMTGPIPRVREPFPAARVASSCSGFATSRFKSQ
jgi:hypothetical protein